MSNEHTHDPQEPTGARLTDDEVAAMTRKVQFLAKRVDGFTQTFLTHAVLSLLADRAALVAENARLQHAYDMNETTMNMQDRALKVQHADLASTLAQNAEMRPLVAELAQGECYYDDSTGDLMCIHCSAVALGGNDEDEPAHTAHCLITRSRALVATLAAGQTPAAPTPDAPTPDAPTPAHYIRMDGGIAEAQGGMLYTTDCDFSEPEWVALLALLNEGHDDLTWEEIAPLVAERIKANAAPTPDGQEGGEG